MILGIDSTSPCDRLTATAHWLHVLSLTIVTIVHRRDLPERNVSMRTHPAPRLHFTYVARVLTSFGLV